MNNIQVMPEQSLASQYTNEQLQLITQTVAKGASRDELQLFLYRCKLLNLNPLKPGQIHFVKYGNSPGTIVVGIEGFRSIAARTGKLSGVKRGAVRNEKGELIGAWAEVYRKDWNECAREEVPFSEYNTGKAMWAKMPETMIKKVAEAAALRMAFPDDLGGVYTQEEMNQADNKTSIAPEKLSEAEMTEHSNGEYICRFGGFAGRTLQESLRVFGVEKMMNAVNLCEEKLAKGETYKNVTIEQMQEFVERASAVIANFENEADGLFEKENENE